jgi:hypothetical protein
MSMSNESRKDDLDDLNEYYLSAIKTDGLDLVTLVFRSLVSQGDLLRQKYITLFDSIVLEATWSCPPSGTLTKPVGISKLPNGRIELSFEFDTGRVLYGCADYNSFVRNKRLRSPGETQ